MDPWGPVRAVGRLGLAILGGGVFAFLAWPAGPSGGGLEDGRGAAISNGPAAGVKQDEAREARSAEVDGLADLARDGWASARAAIAPQRTRASEGLGLWEKGKTQSDDQQGRRTAVAEGADQSNEIANPRGPP